MEYAEATQLVDGCASRLHIKDLLTKEYTDELISDSAGHPYVLKVLLGEVQKEQRRVAVIRRAKTGQSSAPKTGHRVGGIGWKNRLVRTCLQGA
jgi:hypothetical protein